MSTQRRCLECRQVIPVSRKASAKYCSDRCGATYRRHAWVAAHPDIQQAYNRQRHLRSYGMDEAAYHALLELQGGGCALCGKRGTERRGYAMPVDHDHKTGRVRGILCTYCNRNRLGRGREDPAMHRRCADYLEGLL